MAKIVKTDSRWKEPEVGRPHRTHHNRKTAKRAQKKNWSVGLQVKKKRVERFERTREI